MNDVTKPNQYQKGRKVPHHTLHCLSCHTTIATNDQFYILHVEKTKEFTLHLEKGDQLNITDQNDLFHCGNVDCNSIIGKTEPDHITIQDRVYVSFESQILAISQWIQTKEQYADKYKACSFFMRHHACKFESCWYKHPKCIVAKEWIERSPSIFQKRTEVKVEASVSQKSMYETSFKPFQQGYKRWLDSRVHEYPGAPRYTTRKPPSNEIQGFFTKIEKSPQYLIPDTVFLYVVKDLDMSMSQVEILLRALTDVQFRYTDETAANKVYTHLAQHDNFFACVSRFLLQTNVTQENCKLVLDFCEKFLQKCAKYARKLELTSIFIKMPVLIDDESFSQKFKGQFQAICRLMELANVKSNDDKKVKIAPEKLSAVENISKISIVPTLENLKQPDPLLMKNHFDSWNSM
jgi:predicted transcriptional regulator